ncbi:N-acetylmuramoyl-L-alanine amidase [Micromonospora soli]|uniref:N-acetylmuramoyl-L-alanine amidase n=1 Tax=Micromonospora sp. NBRC 110009 TaxID=3061627 RepID=UPI002670D544|nr:N-acetylmuramoyl-L-alanine amidase [Micromonospora sp. NBRC 110009]WKT99398.1 N-acetylmuramoyl-L-alanine amidase [Micromonospora sp. NBRC 110009]
MKLTGIRWTGRRIGIAAATVATAVAGTVSLVAVSYGDGGARWVADGPVTTALHNIDFPATDGREVTIPRRDTDRFALVGVTWTSPKVDFRGTVSVRTRAVGGDWSDWQPLELENHRGPESGAEAARARGGSDPLWVGPSDGVEVRAVAASGDTSDRLPAGLRLELVDPGQPKRRKVGAAGRTPARPAGLLPVAELQALEPTSTEPAPTDTTTAPAPTDTTTAPAETTAPAPTETTAPADTTAPAPTDTTAPAPTTTAPTTAPPTTPPNPVPTPKVVTRAEWKADESIVDPPEYGTTVKAFFVHHTAGTNNYSCADSAAIVRAIEVYHVKSNGWGDIGYNFLVDKCGVVFEGRKGGIDKPVIGAHTYGFNTNNAAIAVLGTYISAGVPTVVQDAIAHVAAYKLGQYRNDPYGTVTLVSGTDGTKYDLGESVVMNRISGHRDAGATECPGDALYSQLRAIRIKAATMSGLALTGLSATKNGTTYYTRGSFTASWSVGTPGVLIDRFEVLVDGAVAVTTAGTARSAAVTVAPGTHTLAIRGVHRLGRVVTTAGVTVVGDATAPTFTRAPELSLRTGTVSTSAVPATVSWRAADNVALRATYLTKPNSVSFSPGRTSWPVTAKPGVATTWSMRATDWAGNSGTASTSRTPVLTAESSAVRSGTWTTASSSSYLGGKAMTSKTRNAWLKWTFTGRSVAVIASRSSTAGQVYVYVDGVKVNTVDLKAGSTAHRQAVWTRTWSGSASHSVMVVVVGTSGRPQVTLDGIAVVR